MEDEQGKFRDIVVAIIINNEKKVSIFLSVRIMLKKFLNYKNFIIEK